MTTTAVLANLLSCRRILRLTTQNDDLKQSIEPLLSLDSEYCVKEFKSFGALLRIEQLRKKS